MRDWAMGTGERWVTMGIASDGSYGIPVDTMYGFPVTCAAGEFNIVQGLPIDEFSRVMMDKTLAELNEEREGIKHLLG
jgi:malate dehydrogenase